jgi:hypothetical protein
MQFMSLAVSHILMKALLNVAYKCNLIKHELFLYEFCNVLMYFHTLRNVGCNLLIYYHILNGVGCNVIMDCIILHGVECYVPRYNIYDVECNVLMYCNRLYGAGCNVLMYCHRLGGKHFSDNQIQC